MTRIEELEKEVELLKTIAELKAKILDYEKQLADNSKTIYVPIYPHSPPVLPYGTYIGSSPNNDISYYPLNT
jgi:hypothetical protein